MYSIICKLALLLAVLFANAEAGSGPGDVVGKITVGYQGWFNTNGDGSSLNRWAHWSKDQAQPPSLENGRVKAFPDVREYQTTYATNYPNFNNGQAARLYSNANAQTVEVHVQWMAQYGIDTLAIQRFNPTSPEGPDRDTVTQHVRTACEKHNRKFYIMYDVTGWYEMQQQIKDDWDSRMSRHITSSAYARQNEKPVVCIWGFGFSDDRRPFTTAQALDVINWFKNKGLYVIGGVPTRWRQGINDARPGYLDTFLAFDMISPWMVGRIGNMDEIDSYYANVQTQDMELINQHNKDFQPCVLPGDLSERQRRHGDFMWKQFYNMVRLGAQGIYISMYDEFDEGNQIAKTAESADWVPSGSGLWALDEDGTRCSADYYLRLTGDGGRMLKGLIGLNPTRPTVPYP